MKILVDTHALLWCISGSESLGKRARDAFLNPENELFFSAASYWEICIKLSIKKLDLGANWEKTIEKELKYNSINWLPILQEHCLALTTLQWHHCDPFDRLLIAQAIKERCAIMTDDMHIRRYEVKIVW